MKSLKVYHYPKCSTCLKAIKFLKAKNLEFDTIDITEKAPTAAELLQVLKSYSGDVKKIINSSGKMYRELNLKDKIGSMSESQLISLLSKNGRLVKRPIILSKDQGLAGFKEEAWKSLLK